MSLDFNLDKVEEEYDLDYFDSEFEEFFERGGVEVFIRFEDSQSVNELIPDYEGLDLAQGSPIESSDRSSDDIHKEERNLKQTASIELEGQKYLLDPLGFHSYTLKLPEPESIIELVDRYPVEAIEPERPFPQE
ncbi:hypothetical protein GKQ38_00750 [Candidatus Nanohaloarchaea archaeon]|nr:hypothetical protein GKQ38_00750 [Candidatus Nanohaloarchaea archaeon]